MSVSTKTGQDQYCTYNYPIDFCSLLKRLLFLVVISIRAAPRHPSIGSNIKKETFCKNKFLQSTSLGESCYKHSTFFETENIVDADCNLLIKHSIFHCQGWV